VQFESTGQAREVLARCPMDFYFAVDFLAIWTQGTDFIGLDGGFVTTIFKGFSQSMHGMWITLGDGWVMWLGILWC